jgi:monooxygenase
VLPVVVYHGEFQVSRDEYDRHVRPLIGNANILAGVGDGFNTPITVCNITKTQVHLDWSYSRPARGENDPLFNAQTPENQARDLPLALLEELGSLQLAEPWAQYINPETIQQHSVFHWISRCVYMPTDDALRAAQAGVVFIGDAWHAMPIFGGEGGNHALVDSVELAAAMVKEANVERAVALYYEGAVRRCQEAVRRSRSRFYVLHRPIAGWRDIAQKRRANEALRQKH